ncbi:MAG: hypothetical protein R3E87_04510 [Burkholderiaceae bacterium]
MSENKKTSASGVRLALSICVAGLICGQAVAQEVTFKPVPAQFIAALGADHAQSGTNAGQWGLWSTDPGMRGVDLDRYPILVRDGGLASAGWRFDVSDWWLEEHGLIMEQPSFPLPSGRYRVTGDRGREAVLTVDPPSIDGRVAWRLSGGATLRDVTHLACRAARYRPAGDAGSCSPAHADPAQFPVDPGAQMPAVTGCRQQDYAVLIVIGIEER